MQRDQLTLKNEGMLNTTKVHTRKDAHNIAHELNYYDQQDTSQSKDNMEVEGQTKFITDLFSHEPDRADRMALGGSAQRDQLAIQGQGHQQIMTHQQHSLIP
jgi:hypothetical protein